MLFRETIAEKTWELLQSISSYPDLEDYYLAGGTALALQFGHRLSYDLDFFAQDDRTNEEIISIIEGSGKIEVVAQTKRVLVMLINNIKVDFVRHPYSLLDPLVHEEKLRLASLRDIGAMKLHAIAGRGRKRDFTDLYFLLQHFTLEELMGAYKQKIFYGNELMVLRSLTYFGDAETDPEIVFVGPSVEWSEIKSSIVSKAKRLL